MSTTLEIAPSPAGLLTLTPAAIDKAREFLSRMDDPEGLYLRLGVRGGGCSGFSYVIEFDRDVDPKYDRLFEFDGLKVVVDRKSLVLLAGTTVDYTGDLHMVGEGGFAFQNPNASRSCGCGVSFQA
ncbi:MAG: HesB/IscA family protein [Armatimonadota bacterium]